MDAHTELYAVFGNPVRHSKGPIIHNAAFQAHGINAVYLAFEIDSIKAGMEAIRTLDIKGASVTIPFKTDIMAELDWIDDTAIKIGAVNTVVNKDGRLNGYNTDMAGACLPLKSSGIAGKTVCILGAGGAAQAVAVGMKKEKANVIIANRSPESGKALADKVGGRFLTIDELSKTSGGSRGSDIQPDILINTTPVGMSPNDQSSPLPDHCFRPGMIVMDIVYNPIETLFLKQAEKAGCTTIDGLSMFLIQGAAQFELWTGKKPDIDHLRQVVLKGD